MTDFLHLEPRVPRPRPPWVGLVEYCLVLALSLFALYVFYLIGIAFWGG